MTTRLSALFNGTGDLSAGNAPDIGGAWALSPYSAGGALTDLVLDGSGNLALPRGNPGAGTSILPLAMSAITPPPGSWRFVTNIALTTSVAMIDTESGAAPAPICILESESSVDGVEILITGNERADTAPPSTDPGTVSYLIYGTNSYNSATFDFDPTVPLQFELLVDVVAVTTTLKLNGATLDVAAFIPATNPAAVHIGGGSMSDATAALIADAVLEDTIASQVQSFQANHLRPRIFAPGIAR